MLNGLMMDDYQLSLTTLVERAERLTPGSQVVSRRGDGSIHRTTLGECAHRARRLASGLAGLGIGGGDRVATLLWNQTEHLELYFAVPLMGAVIHTLNPRLSADDLSYIAADAEDRVLVVDESLVQLVDSLEWDFEHVIVVSHSDRAVGHDRVRAVDHVVRADDLAGDRRATGRRDVLHVGYHGSSEGSHLLTSSTGPPLAGLCPAGRAWDQLTRRDLAGRPDVPRQRVEPAVHGRDDRRETGAAWLSTGSGELAGAARGRARDAHRRGADGVDGRPSGARRGARQMGSYRPERSQPRRGGDVGRLIPGFEPHGLTIIQGWGMTETSPLGTLPKLPADLETLAQRDQYEYRARQGTPIPLIEIRARADDGRLIPWDDEAMGELEIRGPWVAAGYHRGTGGDRWTDDGWFRTGDVVRQRARLHAHLRSGKGSRQVRR